MDTTILSIDPGAKGFLSVLHIGNEITPIECVPIPTCKVKVNKKIKTKIDEDSLSKIIHILIDKYKITEIVIEKQQVISGNKNDKGEVINQGIVSSASTMEQFGWLKGFCAGIKIPNTIVAAKTWQTLYPDYIKQTKELTTKDKSKLYCSILFPDLDLRKTTRCKDVSDGKTDSLLIGVWKARQLQVDNQITA
jgi:hypothetical protein